MSDLPRGWYSRGYLPHIDAGSVPVFLTWRLADSLPKPAFESLLATIPNPRERALRIEELLDEAQGSCCLRQPPCAQAVQETLLHDHGIRYQLHAWCVMPNHVHCLLTPSEGVKLETITRTLKGFSAQRIQKVLGGQGRLWQPESFDRLIRDEEHFRRSCEYIEWNPVKAKLCVDPKHFPYSSANPRNAGKIV